MLTVHIDFETYSEADIKDVGPWAYSKHPSTEVLMMAWAIGDDEPKIWLPGTPYPDWVHDVNRWLKAPPYREYQLTAWNDFFELSIALNILKWSAHLKDPKYWLDAAAEAAALALPRGLEECGEALGLNQEEAKSKEGKDLITLFSKPRKSTRKGVTQLIRTRPQDEPQKFQQFINYCKQDVIAEREIKRRLRPLTAQQRQIWELDRKINLRGVRFDLGAVNDAIVIREKAKEKLLRQVEDATFGGLANVSSNPQFMEYLATLGITLENCQAEYLKDVLKSLKSSPKIDPLAVELFEIRIKIAKSSLAKYDKLLDIVDNDRAYGLLRWHGATTGRWSGNLFQPQNLPRPSFDDTDGCVSLFYHQDPEIIEALYTDALEALSSCLRSMIVPSDGCRLVVSDFSQIESRVLAWLAGDTAKLEGFAKGLDVYKYDAAQVFRVKYEDVTKAQRVIGKVVELACGYQGAVGAFQQFAEVYGVRIPDDEAKAMVGQWRAANPKICSFWYNVEATAVKAVANPGEVCRVRDIAYKVIGSGRRSFLLCQLPSGRQIAYHRPRLVDSKFDKQQIAFYGVDSKTKKYGEQRTYGGKLVENITQATACDIMLDRMPEIEKAGYKILMTVHDEIVTEAPIGHGSINEFNQIMKQTPTWAKGLPINADGYESERYRK